MVLSSLWCHHLYGAIFTMLPSALWCHLLYSVIFSVVSSSLWRHLLYGVIFSTMPASLRCHILHGAIFSMVLSSLCMVLSSLQCHLLYGVIFTIVPSSVCLQRDKSDLELLKESSIIFDNIWFLTKFFSQVKDIKKYSVSRLWMSYFGGWIKLRTRFACITTC